MSEDTSNKWSQHRNQLRNKKFSIDLMKRKQQNRNCSTENVVILNLLISHKTQVSVTFILEKTSVFFPQRGMGPVPVQLGIFRVITSSNWEKKISRNHRNWEFYKNVSILSSVAIFCLKMHIKL